MTAETNAPATYVDPRNLVGLTFRQQMQYVIEVREEHARLARYQHLLDEAALKLQEWQRRSGGAAAEFTVAMDDDYRPIKITPTLF